MREDPDGRKVAFITGAADGLGAGAATRLVRDGWAVLMFDRNPTVVETADALRASENVDRDTVLGHVGDVASEDDISSALSRLGDKFQGLDLALANAGVAAEGVDLCDVASDDFNRVIEVNLYGVYLTCRAAGEIMRKQGAGCIVTTSSIFGVEPVAGASAYCASKAAVIALTKSMSLEMAPHGVRVNSIAPGYMRSEMQWEAIRRKARDSGRTFEEERLRTTQLVPLGRHGEPDDFAGAVAFLASDDASYITGHTLGVTGGVVSW